MEPLTPEMVEAMIPGDHVRIPANIQFCAYHGMVEVIDPTTGKTPQVWKEAWTEPHPNGVDDIYFPAGEYPGPGGICCVCLDLEKNQGWTTCPAHGLQPPAVPPDGKCRICSGSAAALRAVAAGLEPASGEALARAVEAEPANLALVPTAGGQGPPGAPGPILPVPDVHDGAGDRPGGGSPDRGLRGGTLARVSPIAELRKRWAAGAPIGVSGDAPGESLDVPDHDTPEPRA